MQRPRGVSVIACFFLAAGVYLCSFSTVTLVAPRALPMLKAAPLIRGLRIASPYVTLLVGTTWALVAWGLFRVRDWARLVATLVLAVGVAWEASLILFGRTHFGWQVPLAWLEMALRVGAIWYLMSPTVIDAF